MGSGTSPGATPRVSLAPCVAGRAPVIPVVLRRLGWAIPTLFVVVTLAFLMMRFTPGGPFNVGQALPPQVLENLNRTYRLDQPLLDQYLDFLARLARGDLGPSYSYRDFTVTELIARALPYSLEIGALALTLSVALGVGAGLAAAARRGSALDAALTGAASLGTTLPSFVTAPLLSLVFAVGLGWLPAAGWGHGALANKVLPVTALALPQMAAFARLTRAAMVEALQSDHFRTMRAYGFSERRIVAHALRGAAGPIVSYLGPCAAALLTGSVVIETIFGIPGVGRFFVQGALNRDYPLVMGTVILVAVFILIFNLLVDLAYAALDPRTRDD